VSNKIPCSEGLLVVKLGGVDNLFLGGWQLLVINKKNKKHKSSMWATIGGTMGK
jgi:hypothetical protein